MNIQAWMYGIGHTLAQRSGWTPPQALSILYHIALNGEFIATEVLFPLTILSDEEIAAACKRLEDEEFNCHWCNNVLTFLQMNGFSQFSPDNCDPTQTYTTPGNHTVRSCLFCQRFFNDTSKRFQMMNQIIGNYLTKTQRQSFLDLGSLEDRIALAARTPLNFSVDRILADFIAQDTENDRKS